MSMTPDKTLEELASHVAYKVSLLPTYRWVDDKSISPIENKEAYREIALEALQSAIAAQQREVERLSEQLRTEREKYKELFMKAQDLVEELKSE